MDIVKVKNWASIRRGQVFTKLGADPRKWSFSGVCRRGVGHYGCQLCDTSIVRLYRLESYVGTSKEQFLWVGSECIRHFYEVWMPNGLERAIELLKKSQRGMRNEQNIAKLAGFREVLPLLVDYLTNEQSYLDKTFPDGTKVSKIRSSLRRKGYLRTDELEYIATQNQPAIGYQWYFGLTRSVITKIQNDERFQSKYNKKNES